MEIRDKARNSFQRKSSKREIKEEDTEIERLRVSIKHMFGRLEGGLEGPRRDYERLVEEIAEDEGNI